MEVIFIGTYNESEILSGPEKVCKRVFEEYSKLGSTLFIHYFQDGRDYSYLKKLFGCEKTTTINNNPVLRLGIIRMLYYLIKLKPSNIHILNFNRFVVFIFIVKLFMRVNIIYTLNGIIRHENKYYNRESLINVIKNIIVENVIIYLSDRILYLSKFSISILSIYYSINKIKFTKVINGLDECFLNQNNVCNKTKILHTIVFIGDIQRKEKGFHFLMKSLFEIDKQIKLFLISAPVNGTQVQINDTICVKFIDKMTTDKMIKFLNDKNIIFAASEYDQFPISVLEAISCGMTPIMTKENGLSEIIGDYCPSEIVKYGDVFSLANIIRKKLANKSDPIDINKLKDFSWGNVLKYYYIPHYE